MCAHVCGGGYSNQPSTQTVESLNRGLLVVLNLLDILVIVTPPATWQDAEKLQELPPLMREIFSRLSAMKAVISPAQVSASCAAVVGRPSHHAVPCAGSSGDAHHGGRSARAAGPREASRHSSLGELNAGTGEVCTGC